MYDGFLEEGDACPECRNPIEFELPENCSCHISPPCAACTSVRLHCKKCGWIDESEESHYAATEYPGLSILVRRPKPLDETKISWRSKSHSNSSMLKEGIYPKGTTITEVREKVKGSFGGRFESFGNGRFKYVAYTD